MLIDCHVHLDSYSDSEVPEVLQRGRDVGVSFVISAGTTLPSSERTIELSSKFPDFFAGVGIHPMDIREPFDDETYAHLNRLAVSSEKVLVISEIGLDFMEGAPDRSIQYTAFREQIRLARELGYPIVFHSREAHDEVFRLLREERAYEVGGVMHYFQGDLDTAKRAIDLGFYISWRAHCCASLTCRKSQPRHRLNTSSLKPTQRHSRSRQSGKTGPSRDTLASSPSDWLNCRTCRLKKWRQSHRTISVLCLVSDGKLSRST